MNLFDIAAVRAQLGTVPFYVEDDDQVASRRLFVGTVFNLLPSGKYYTPWACSNLALCSRCGGRGAIRACKRRRVRKRALARSRRLARMFATRRAKWEAMARQRRQAFRCAREEVQCPHCGGCGSREAYEDQLWLEAAEAQLGGVGLHLESGEGDPCDLFIVEYGDEPEEN